MYQKIIGFGGAFTDAVGINILSLPSPMPQRIIQEYFSPDGLAYNIGRVPIGGTDFSIRKYTYNDNSPGDLLLTNFSLAEEDYKFKVKWQFQIYILIFIY
jgi:glucosylceramidase